MTPSRFQRWILRWADIESSESSSIPQRLKKAVDFLAKHNIKPEVQFRQLEDLNDMVNEMKTGKATKRMVVSF